MFANALSRRFYFMKFEIHRSPPEMFCLTPCRSAQTAKNPNRESLGSNLSRGTSYMTSLGRIITSNTVHSNTTHTHTDSTR